MSEAQKVNPKEIGDLIQEVNDLTKEKGYEFESVSISLKRLRAENAALSEKLTQAMIAVDKAQGIIAAERERLREAEYVLQRYRHNWDRSADNYFTKPKTPKKEN